MTAWLVGGAGVAGLVAVLFAFLWRGAKANAAMWQVEAQRRAGELIEAARAASENDVRRQLQVEALRAENKKLADGMAELAKRYPQLAAEYLRSVLERASATSRTGPHATVSGPAPAGVPTDPRRGS